jgi:xanthine dehydrogenase accessory factor
MTNTREPAAREQLETDDAGPPKPRGAEPAEVLRVAAEAVDRGARVVLATVLARRGSTPATPGQKLVLTDEGHCVGTVGGGALEHDVLRTLAAWLRDPEPPASHIETWKLGAELGMCCGGSVDVLFEALAVATPILVVGAGHIGSIVAPLLARSGFAVSLVDARDAWIEDQPDEPRLSRHAGDFDDVGRGLRRAGAVVAMTHDHQLDQQVIEWALREGFAFVGGVGSRAKHVRTLQRLEMKGFSEADRARVRMPLGLEIGARSPHEIAISIVAELIGWRRGAHAAKTASGDAARSTRGAR